MRLMISQAQILTSGMTKHNGSPPFPITHSIAYDACNDEAWLLACIDTGVRTYAHLCLNDCVMLHISPYKNLLSVCT